MSVFAIILMIAAGIGAAVGMRKSKAGVEWGHPLAIVCAVFALVLAVAGLLKSSDTGSKLEKSLGSYSYACGVTLGQHLAENYAGSRALVLMEPVFAGREPHELQVSVLEGLKVGMGSALELVDTVAVDPPEAFVARAQNREPGAEPSTGETNLDLPYERQNIDLWFNANYLARFLSERKGTYDVLISTVGLPRGFENSGLAGSSDLPVMAVLNAPGTPMKELILNGTLDVVVADKPSVNPWHVMQNVPKDVDEAFDKRFVLVTKDNLAEVVATFPTSPNWR